MLSTVSFGVLDSDLRQELLCVRVVRPSKLASSSSLYELRLDTGTADPYMEGRCAARVSAVMLHIAALQAVRIRGL